MHIITYTDNCNPLIMILQDFIFLKKIIRINFIRKK